MKLKEKLSAIQREMKAPKNLYNHFGNYKYRNAEGILEAFKPYEEKYGVAMVVQDKITVIGSRTYVKATATIMDTESEEKIQATAYAREPETKKGMDDSQITGTASSYARKYALNGLLLLDDTKDADSDEYHEQTSGEKVKKDALPEAMQKTLETCIPKHNQTVENVCEFYKVGDLSELTVEQFKSLMDQMGEKA